jgi:hypothetical protein
MSDPSTSTTLSLSAARALLARFPPRPNNGKGKQRASADDGDGDGDGDGNTAMDSLERAVSPAEKERQEQLLKEVEGYQGENDLLRNQLRRVSFQTLVGLLSGEGSLPSLLSRPWMNLTLLSSRVGG